MRLRLFRSLWGVIPEADGVLARSPVSSFSDACRSIAALGYDGIECPLKLAYAVGTENFRATLETNALDVCFQIFTDGPVAPGADDDMHVMGGPYASHPTPGDTIHDHLAVFAAQARAAAEFDPVLINSHSLRDYYTHSDAREFFKAALDFQKAEGIGVLHETHRKRYLYSPWVVRDILDDDELSDLEFVADLSHFTCVGETDPSDRQLTKLITALAPRVRHIHGRVGYDHSPQVADPRAPEWMAYTEGFQRWWEIIWEAQSNSGADVSTFTPEHGPPNYQQTMPHTQEPLANIWEVNHFIACRQRDRFAQIYGEGTTAQVIDQ